MRTAKFFGFLGIGLLFSGSGYRPGTAVGDLNKEGIYVAAAAVSTYTVTPSGSHVSINPSTAQTVNSGDTTSFTVTADSGYTVSNTVTGTCPAGSFAGSVYTTGAITADCTVSFSGTLITPDTIAGSALKLWVKADSLSLNDNDAVSTWADQSGNGYNLAEATNPPTYKTNIQNSLPIVRFDGSNDVLKTSTNFPNIIANNAATILIVLNIRGATGTNQLTSQVYKNPAIWTEFTGANIGAYVRDPGSPEVISFQNWGSPEQVEVNAAAINSWGIYMFRHDSGSIYISINGGAETSTASGNTGAFASPLAIGQSNGGAGLFLRADYAEIIMCNTTLDSTKRSQLLTYLNNKWAVY